MYYLPRHEVGVAGNTCGIVAVSVCLSVCLHVCLSVCTAWQVCHASHDFVVPTMTRSEWFVYDTHACCMTMTLQWLRRTCHNYRPTWYVQPVGAANVKVYGPAVDAAVKAHSISYLIVDCKEAGPGLSLCRCWLQPDCSYSWCSLILCLSVCPCLCLFVCLSVRLSVKWQCSVLIPHRRYSGDNDDWTRSERVVFRCHTGYIQVTMTTEQGVNV